MRFQLRSSKSTAAKLARGGATSRRQNTPLTTAKRARARLDQGRAIRGRDAADRDDRAARCACAPARGSRCARRRVGLVVVDGKKLPESHVVGACRMPAHRPLQRIVAGHADERGVAELARACATLASCSPRCTRARRLPRRCHVVVDDQHAQARQSAAGGGSRARVAPSPPESRYCTVYAPPSSASPDCGERSAAGMARLGDDVGRVVQPGPAHSLCVSGRWKKRCGMYWPAPGWKPRRNASNVYRCAASTAARGALPCASSAAMAEASVQPEP